MIRDAKRIAGFTMEWMGRIGAQSYTAGPALSDALAVCREPPNNEKKFIIGFWDRGASDPRSVSKRCFAALDALELCSWNCHLSIKLPSLNYDIGVVSAIAERAAITNRRIHFDALSAESVDRTLKVLRTLRSSYSNLGCTAVSRWKRSSNDLEQMKSLEIPIRLVTGQIPDRAGGELDPHTNYVKLVEQLQGYRSQVGLACHNLLAVKLSAQLLGDSGTSWELEQLFRLRPIRSLEDGLTVEPRLYVPFGHGFTPYDVYEAWRRPEIGIRLLRDFASGAALKAANSARGATVASSRAGI